MKRFSLTLAALVALAVFTTNSASASDRYVRNIHSNVHDSLNHYSYHRNLTHTQAHRYRMSYGQHGQLHDSLNHDAYHDRLQHRQTHRVIGNSYGNRFGSYNRNSFGNGIGYNNSRRFGNGFGYINRGLSFQTRGFSFHLAR